MYETVVTKVIIESFTPQDNGTCAEASVIINDALAIHKILVVNGERGLFVTMPNTGQTRMSKEGKRYTDLIHPLSKDFSGRISEAVLSAYNERLKK